MLKRIHTLSRRQALAAYRSLMRIRNTELRVEALYHLDAMKTPVHLALGQEAVAVGICEHLKAQDMIFSNHRSHAHYLAKGGDLSSLIAEFYCRETGCARGRGGSMHVIDKRVGHYGSSAIVGGGIAHGVGAALAFKMRKEKRIAAVFFGDAASEEGVFFESMNLAMLKKVPVLFVCENNRYSVCSPITVRQPNDQIFQRAKAFGLPSRQINGMDFFEVFACAKEIVLNMRKNQMPFLLECRVERWRGHAGSGDPLRAQYRLPEDIKEMEKTDPVKQLESYILRNKIASATQLEKMIDEINLEIAGAFDFAQKSPLPGDKELQEYLFVKS